MRLLLDSHTLIWSADRPDQITSAAMTAMGDPANELLVIAATIWEIAIKFGLGRLPLSLPFRHWMNRAMADLGLVLLPITLDHAERHASLLAASLALPKSTVSRYDDSFLQLRREIDLTHHGIHCFFLRALCALGGRAVFVLALFVLPSISPVLKSSGMWRNWF
jgi:PIN domain nuclease of toxin-antitoxin system